MGVVNIDVYWFTVKCKTKDKGDNTYKNRIYSHVPNIGFLKLFMMDLGWPISINDKKSLPFQEGFKLSLLLKNMVIWLFH